MIYTRVCNLFLFYYFFLPRARQRFIWLFSAVLSSACTVYTTYTTYWTLRRVHWLREKRGTPNELSRVAPSLTTAPLSLQYGSIITARRRRQASSVPAVRFTNALYNNCIFRRFWENFLHTHTYSKNLISWRKIVFFVLYKKKKSHKPFVLNSLQPIYLYLFMCKIIIMCSYSPHSVF